MKWCLQTAQRGDMVRVRIGSLYHYGIFVSEDEVIQFGPPPVNSLRLNDSEIEVCSTDVYAFLSGGFMEVAVSDRSDKKKRRSATDTVASARSRLGEKGYNILYNNCEHFANECAFGEKFCSQTESLRDTFRHIPILDVYVAAIPDDCAFDAVFPPARRQEIASCSNPAVKRQKYAVWKLLEYALKRSFGYDIRKLKFAKGDNGKWTSSECEFSLSHSNNAVAVALSRRSVGVDIEAVAAVRDELSARILTDAELATYSALSADKQEYLSRKWTEKESLFKMSNEKNFCPSNIDVSGQNLRTERLTVDGNEYFLTVASDDIAKFRLFNQIKL